MKLLCNDTGTRCVSQSCPRVTFLGPDPPLTSLTKNLRKKDHGSSCHSGRDRKEVFYDTRKCNKHIRNHVVNGVHLHPNGTRTLYENIWNDVTLNFKVNGEGHAFDNAIFVFTELGNIRFDIIFKNTNSDNVGK